MSAMESRAKLIQAAKKLIVDWQQARETWRDENCRQFEKKYISPLESNIRAAAQAMERIGTMLDSAQRDSRDSTEDGL
jgi:hypothetical protein